MGGIGHAMRHLVDHLSTQANGHQYVALLCAKPLENINWNGVELVQTESGMIDAEFEQIGLPNLLDELKIDLYFNPTFSVPALKTTAYQVAIIHDVVFEEKPQWVEPGLCDYLRRWARFAANHADHIVTVSNHAKARIKQVYEVPENRITRIYNGIPKTAFQRPLGPEIVRARKSFDLERDYILYLGSLETKKGIVELLEAFSSLSTSVFSGDLVLAGAGGHDIDLPAKLRKLGCESRVKLLGYVDESSKASLMAGCELFVYPSWYEGFGLPPLEAMALGVPTLVSNLTSLPEVVGDAALVVDISNKDAFVDALRRGLTDKEFRGAARENGPRRASRFSWEIAAKQYSDLFDSVMGA